MMMVQWLFKGCVARGMIRKRNVNEVEIPKHQKNATV